MKFCLCKSSILLNWNVRFVVQVLFISSLRFDVSLPSLYLFSFSLLPLQNFPSSTNTTIKRDTSSFRNEFETNTSNVGYAYSMDLLLMRNT